MKSRKLASQQQPYNPRRLFGSLSASGALLLITTSTAIAQVKETVLYSFTGGANGEGPDSDLLADTSGPGGALRGLYGTAYDGSAPGVAFRLVPPTAGKSSWTDTTLWSFTGGKDGGDPSGLSLPTTAKRISSITPLYGTTEGGGAGYGTVFSLAGRKLTTLWTFTGGSDGGEPFGDATPAKDGTLYVTAYNGGGPSNCGTVIKLTPPQVAGTPWAETTIWKFLGKADGCDPIAGVIIDSSGALYGTTTGDSEQAGPNNIGTAFKLIPPANGQGKWTEQTLAIFQPTSNGVELLAPLTPAGGGNYYGANATGGIDNQGYIFELLAPESGKTAWRSKTLYSFTGGTGGSDGGQPLQGQLIVDKNGAIYGTGSANYGNVFKLTPPGSGHGSWTESTLWTFTGGSGGYEPLAGLVGDKAGTLYGTVTFAGPTNNEFVFSLTGTGYVPP